MNYSRFVYFFGALIAIGLAVSLRIDAPQAEAAFGVSPPWVKNDHLLPGTTYEQIINLSRSDTDRDMKVTTRIDGDKEIEKWIKIENEDDLMIKKGQKILPMKVIVKVPRRAAIKDYKGGIFVTLESVQDETLTQGGTVAIKLGAHITVDLTVVGEEVTDYRIKSVSLDQLYEGESYYINAEIENLGNTEITKLNGQIDIYDKKETEILQSLTFGDLDKSVSPDETVTTKISLPNVKLESGEYWLLVKIYKDNESIYENRLYQKIETKVVPVVTPEDVGVTKPSIPKIPSLAESDKETGISGKEAGESVATTDTTLRTAAPVKPVISTPVFILIIVGVAFGIISMIAVVILLVILIRNQRQAAIQRYLTQQNTTTPTTIPPSQ